MNPDSRDNVDALDQTAVEELRTLGDCVRWGASRFGEAGLFFGHGTDNALDEARVLALHALHLGVDLPDRYLDARLTRLEREQVLALFGRRIRERLPAPYITGEAWFAGLAFEIDARALVPRSPIAELIEAGFAPWLDPAGVTRVLDIGTGCGCIAVACALALPDARVDAVDTSDEALALAQHNIRRYGLGDRVNALHSDVYEALAGARYDLIVANPPYVPRASMEMLPGEYRCEPASALVAGDDGLDVVRRILAGAPDHLEADGLLVVEVGEAAPYLEQACADLPLTWLDFERGGEGVFLLTGEQVQQYAAELRALTASEQQQQEG